MDTTIHSPGDRPGGYEIISLIHMGRESRVYLSRKVSGEPFYAIKQLWSGSALGEEKNILRRQFEQEVRILRTLRDPGIPLYHESFSEGMWHYLVMEFIEGRTLQQVKKERGEPVEVREAVNWALQICRTLTFLHNRAHPVIFRDLKPSHIMLAGDTTIKLIDFGIARLFDDMKEKDTYVMGTMGYAAPEQYGAHQTGPRTDIYALGATLYDLLTMEDICQFFLKFPPLRRYNRSVPPWLEKLISRCLEHNPEKRYPDANSLRKEIQRGIDRF